MPKLASKKRGEVVKAASLVAFHFDPDLWWKLWEETRDPRALLAWSRSIGEK